MAYDTLKTEIRQYIQTNGQQEITGQILQNVLLDMVNAYPSLDGYATQQWVQNQEYVTASALSSYATQQWVQNQLFGYLPLTGGNLDGNLSIYDTMNIYSSSIEWNDDGDYCRITFDDDGITVTAHGTGYVIANEFIRNGGTSSQFLKADGSVDNNTYLSSADLSGYATETWVGNNYLPLTGGNLNGNLSIYDTMNIYSSSIEWNDNGDYCRITFDDDGITVTAHGSGYVIANEFIRNGGTSAQFLKADGSVDSNTYLTSSAISDMATQTWVGQQGFLTSVPSGYATETWVSNNYLSLTGGNLNGNLSIYGTMNIYSSSIEWNDNGDYCRITFDDDGITVTAHGTGYIIANEFVKNGGTSSQFLKADGSVDSNTYLTSAAISDMATQTWVGNNYLPLAGGTITGNLTVTGTLTASDGNMDIRSAGSGAGNSTIFEFTNSQDVLFDGSPFYDFGNAELWAGSYHQASDVRKKTITGDVPMNLYNVANAPLFKFTWKDEKKYSGQHIGTSAQYWQTVLPELISKGRDADMTLAMQYDVAALAGVITVAKVVVDHEDRINAIERKLNIN